ncbi:hypothetical protein LTR37_008777 [Vermiconidia calcicola]|uniref:Uncharacterized protein n=1 Tax=Vermiconidia calcicola TaxID=1690605 RepID=A0ACC3N9J0_9PEZI|nr:hypothetical protein LTR37_008777 [Vermiconidia calcicola]
MEIEMNEDMPPGLGQRALDWIEGDMAYLAELAHDVSDAFNSDEDADRLEMRSACEELLYRERLPAFYRACFLMYMACTEDDEDVEKIRERLEDAQYWVNDVEDLLTNAGLQDSRVDQLQRNIAASRALIDEYDEDEGDEGDEATAEATVESQAVAESKIPLLPSGRKGWIKGSEFKPGDLGPPFTADDRYSMMKDVKRYEREVLAAEASQTAKETKPSGTGTSTTRTETTYDSSGRYHGASTAGAEPLVLEYPEPSSPVRSSAPTTTLPVRPASPTLAAQAPEPEDKRVSRTGSLRLPKLLRLKKSNARLHEAAHDGAGGVVEPGVLKKRSTIKDIKRIFSREGKKDDGGAAGGDGRTI